MSPQPKIGVAIIGAGEAGLRRALSLPPGHLVTAFDLNTARSEALVARAGCGKATRNIEDAIHHPSVDAVIISTVHRPLAEVALGALADRKHVLIESPGAASARQLGALEKKAKPHGLVVRVGFHHRSRRAVAKARKLVEEGQIGGVMFLRGCFGTARPMGFERSWRADLRKCAGGQLLDEGIHLLDLANWFVPRFNSIRGTLSNLYWQMPVEDNAFVELRNSKGQIAWLHTSSTEWKDRFSFEIFGQKGKLQIEGYHGIYGPERLHVHALQPGSAPPETIVYEYPDRDTSWDDDTISFLRDIELQRRPSPGLPEAQAALEMVEKIYSQTGYPIPNVPHEVLGRHFDDQ
ncbi:MAG: Gfo/Idh/MocA family oxidoreductase [Verrucomicrobiota bacterium]